MDVRTRTEEIERLTLAPWATFSDESRGRQRPEEQDPIRPVFQRDRDRVLHCKAFRRLKQKTQVFLSPEGDLYRTRLTSLLTFCHQAIQKKRIINGTTSGTYLAVQKKGFFLVRI